eukprot:299822-Chlamydomonas_euryale.AAC.1
MRPSLLMRKPRRSWCRSEWVDGWRDGGMEGGRGLQLDVCHHWFPRARECVGDRVPPWCVHDDARVCGALPCRGRLGYNVASWPESGTRAGSG